MRTVLRSHKLLALTFVTAMASIAACAAPTDAGSSPSFRATLSGSLNMSVVGTAAVDTGGSVRSIPGPPGVAATTIALQSADHRDVVSFYVPGMTLAPGTYSIRALNSVGTVPATGAAFVHYQDDGNEQIYQGAAGTLTITSNVGGVTRGEFAFQASGYDVYPGPTTGPLDTPLTRLGHSDVALAMNGSFVAVRSEH